MNATIRNLFVYGLFLTIIPVFSQQVKTKSLSTPKAELPPLAPLGEMRPPRVEVHLDEVKLESIFEDALEEELRSMEKNLERMEILIKPIEINLAELNLNLDPVIINIPDLVVDIAPFDIDLDLDVPNIHLDEFEWGDDLDVERSHHDEYFRKEDFQAPGKEKSKEKDKLKDKSGKEKSKVLKKIE